MGEAPKDVWVYEGACLGVHTNTGMTVLKSRGKCLLGLDLYWISLFFLLSFLVTSLWTLKRDEW